MSKIVMPSAQKVSLDTKLSDIDKQKKIISTQINIIYNNVVNNGSKLILSLEDLRRLQIMGDELREIYKFEKELEETGELENLSDEQIMKLLKQKKVK